MCIYSTMQNKHVWCKGVQNTTEPYQQHRCTSQNIQHDTLFSQKEDVCKKWEIWTNIQFRRYLTLYAQIKTFHPDITSSSL